MAKWVLALFFLAACGGDDDKVENCDFCCMQVDPPSGCTVNETHMACTGGLKCSLNGNPR